MGTQPVISQLIWEKEKDSQGTDKLAAVCLTGRKEEQGQGLGQRVGVGWPELQEGR